MTFPPTGYHAREVTLGCMAKGKGVSSRASLLISTKVLVGNVVGSGHHAKAVSLDYLLNKKKKKSNKQQKNKRQEWVWKKCIHDRYNSPSTKAPTGNTLHPCPSLHPHAWTSPDHITHSHGLDEVSSGNFPFPVDTSPIGHFVFSSRFV
jgi:hypothetical protein